MLPLALTPEACSLTITQWYIRFQIFSPESGRHTSGVRQDDSYDTFKPHQQRHRLIVDVMMITVMMMMTTMM